MKIAYFDCIAGISGDMILGALIDAGLPLATLQEQLARLDMHGEFTLQAQRVTKNGFKATKVDVHIPHDAPDADHLPAHSHSHGRHLAEIEAVLQHSRLPASIQQRAGQIFRRLAEVEAGIHDMPVEEVHLHEVGGVDTIVDVTGALLGLEALGIEKVFASALPLGGGFVRGAHGQIPLPAPATVALLKGVAVRGSEIEKELVTPTGAAILTSISSAFGPIPSMTLKEVGYGAGGRDLAIPNVVRLLIGEQEAGSVETLALLETNVDNCNPEIFGYLMERLLALNALDVFFSPIQMKKNRPATLISVLCRPTEAEALTAVLFAETTTLGVRQMRVERRCLERSSETVVTPYGAVRVKTARLPDGSSKRAPEYEDCRKAALEHGVALRLVYAAAEQAAA